MFSDKISSIRKGVSYLLISLLVGGAVYIKQTTEAQKYIDNLYSEIGRMQRTHTQEILLLESQLNSMVSRAKHLSADNSRLSSTGHKLYKQLAIGNSVTEEKIAANRKLHKELSSLDQDLINKYQDFITQQSQYEKLNFECKGGKSKVSTCQGYSAADEAIKNLENHLKHLNAKREVLLSEIDRYGCL